MLKLRSIVFWMHLAAGVAAGLVILVMSVTGALLALKPQILAVAERDARFVAVPPGASRLGVQAIVASAQRERPAMRPASVTLQAEATASASVAFGRDATVYVDPYSGRVLGDGSKRAQRSFRTLEDWHRWLGVSAESRASGRAITGASNLAFFFLALTGPYLWWPRGWSWRTVRGIVWFRSVRGRARDFNWHNVIGLWCAPILIVLTITGVVMSYPWANALLFQLAGTPVPVSVAAPAVAPAPAGESVVAPLPEKLDAAWALAVNQVPSWRTMTLRLPSRSRAPVSFTIVDGRSWNAFARSQLTVDAAGAEVSKWEPYDASPRGQKWRGWARFGHTGELAGLPGQIVAGIACVGAAVLVWTGLALAYRRLAAWRRSPARVIATVSTRAERALSSADR